MFVDTAGCPRYLCSRCNATRKNESSLRYHMRYCGKLAECSICGFICAQRRYLRDHMFSHFKQSEAYQRRNVSRQKRKRWNFFGQKVCDRNMKICLTYLMHIYFFRFFFSDGDIKFTAAKQLTFEIKILFQ